VWPASLIIFSSPWCLSWIIVNPVRRNWRQPPSKGYINFVLSFGGTQWASQVGQAKDSQRIVQIASKRFLREDGGLPGNRNRRPMKEPVLTWSASTSTTSNRRDGRSGRRRIGSGTRSLGGTVRWIPLPASDGPPVTYESLVDEYLSEAHRNLQNWLSGRRSGKGTPASTKRTRNSRFGHPANSENIELLATLLREGTAMIRRRERKRSWRLRALRRPSRGSRGIVISGRPSGKPETVTTASEESRFGKFRFPRYQTQRKKRGKERHDTNV